MTPSARRLVPTALAVATAAALGGAFASAPAQARPVLHAGPTTDFAAHGTTYTHVAPDFMRGHRTGLRPGRVTAGGTGRTNNDSSENWSGYIKSGSGYTGSTATWTVPTVSTQYDGYSSTWVGIDGATSNDQYLIQTGTEQDVQGGQTNYDAWWEVITPTDPAPETIFSNLDISPGDSITATVAKSSSGTWRMSLTDNTTGQSASHSSAFAGPGDSAEWIQEDTDVDNSISTAPDWGSVNFSDITVNGGNPDLGSAQAVDIVDGNGTQEDSTSAPNGSGDGFTVTWLAPGTETPIG